MNQNKHRAMTYLILGITCFIWKSYTITVAFLIIGINLIYGAFFHKKIGFHSVSLIEIASAIILITLGLFLPKVSMYLISIFYLFISISSIIDHIKMKILDWRNNLESLIMLPLGLSIIVNINNQYNFIYYITGILLILEGIYIFIFEKDKSEEEL